MIYCLCMAVLSKGQAATGLYRFLTKHGGYVWMETSAALTGDENCERRERHVICVNYAIRFVLQLDFLYAQKSLLGNRAKTSQLLKSVTLFIWCINVGGNVALMCKILQNVQR